MPAAVTNTEETIRKDLKTLPEGFVVLRRMTYGQIVQRRTMNKLSVLSQNKKSSVMGEMAMASKEMTIFEFSHCVVDHNLEDMDGRKLNLGNPVDVDKLNPRVGQELESLISELNNFEDDEEEIQGN